MDSPTKMGKILGAIIDSNRIRIITNVKAIDAGESHVELSDGETIPCTTFIWTGGVTTNSMIESLTCEHDKGGRVLADKYLRLKGHPEVFALGDCAAISDVDTGKFYPPTAQHALRESKIVA